MYGAEIVPPIVPVLSHIPSKLAAAGVKPATSSHVIVTTGQVIVAGAAPVTLTMHNSLISFPHASVPA